MFDAKLAESVSGNSGFGVDNALFNQLAPAALGKGWESEIGDLNYLQNKPIQSFYQKSESYGKYDSLIRSAGRRYNIAPGLIHAVINAESNEDSTIVSHKGAKGLMQLMDSTSTYLGVDDPFDPKQNIEAGTKYLRVLLDRFDGKLDLALAAYNSGPETVEKYGGIPPYRETENYVKSILQKLSMNESTTRSGT
ncbi:MAG: lytic transglycosylase domain-containing protein [candidate division Zixibacteria bacterium]|nr:lytic transglycosylase domain-containing protein [candidate division Zixibacteria bacterium]